MVDAPGAPLESIPRTLPQRRRRGRLLAIACVLMLLDLAIMPSMKDAKLAGDSVGAVRIGAVSVSLSEVLNVVLVGLLVFQWGRARGWSRAVPQRHRIAFAVFAVLIGAAAVLGVDRNGLVPVLKETRLLMFLAVGVSLAAAYPHQVLLRPFVGPGLRRFRNGCGLVAVLTGLGTALAQLGVPMPSVLGSGWEKLLVLLLFGLMAFFAVVMRGVTVGRLVTLIAVTVAVGVSFSKPVYFGFGLAVLFSGAVAIRFRGARGRRVRRWMLTAGAAAVTVIAAYAAGAPLPYRQSFEQFVRVRVLKNAETQGVENVDLSAGRVDIWRTGLTQTWQQQPWGGAGLGAEIEPDYAVFGEPYQTEPKQAHNLLVSVIYQAGFPAGLVLFFLFAGVFTRTMRFARRLVRRPAVDDRGAPAVVACIVFMWSILGVSMVGLVVKQPRLAFVLGLSFAVVLSALLEERRRRAEGRAAASVNH